MHMCTRVVAYYLCTVSPQRVWSSVGLGGTIPEESGWSSCTEHSPIIRGQLLCTSGWTGEEGVGWTGEEGWWEEVYGTGEEEECARLGRRSVLDWGGGVCWTGEEGWWEEVYGTGEEECAGLGRGSAQL